MAISKWICCKSTKNMFVKIVHPGGHKELHDRPILASEIMLRNPNCIIAHPHVFQEPWAIVPPDTILMQGQKFYVVPISTIKKLQRQWLKHSPDSPVNYNTHVSDDDQALNNKNLKEIREGYCLCTFNGIIKIKANNKGDYVSSDGSSQTNALHENRINKKLIITKRSSSSSPNRSIPSCDHWQPALDSISEE